MKPKPANVFIVRKPCGCFDAAIPDDHSGETAAALNRQEYQGNKITRVSWFYFVTTILTEAPCTHAITAEVTA